MFICCLILLIFYSFVQVEYPIPEQFKTTITPSGLSTVVADIAGWKNFFEGEKKNTKSTPEQLDWIRERRKIFEFFLFRSTVKYIYFLLDFNMHFVHGLIEPWRAFFFSYLISRWYLFDALSASQVLNFVSDSFEFVFIGWIELSLPDFQKKLLISAVSFFWMKSCLIH